MLLALALSAQVVAAAPLHLVEVGVVGLVAGIAGLVIGMNASAEAKATREELIRERDGLQQQLKALEGRPPSVQTFGPPQSLVAVAVF